MISPCRPKMLAREGASVSAGEGGSVSFTEGGSLCSSIKSSTSSSIIRLPVTTGKRHCHGGRPKTNSYGVVFHSILNGRI